jgi:hypothetical protein
MLRERFGPFIALVAAALLSGCASDYGEAVKAFHEAAAANEAAVVANQKVLRDILIETEREAVLSREASLLPTGCRSDSIECTVKFVYKDSTLSLTPAQLDPPMQNIVALAGDLKGYAGALKAISDSDAISKIEAAVDETSGKLKKLVDTTGEVAKRLNVSAATVARATEVDWSAPVSQSVKWAFGQYVQAAKVDALRTATQAAKEPVTDWVNIYRQADTAVRDSQKARLAQDITVARATLSASGGRTRSNYDEYMQTISVYQAFLAQKPGAIADKLGAAHAKLSEALDGKPRSLSDAWRFMEQAVAEAQSLQKIVAAFEELQKQRRKAP